MMLAYITNPMYLFYDANYKKKRLSHQESSGVTLTTAEIERNLANVYSDPPAPVRA